MGRNLVGRRLRTEIAEPMGAYSYKEANSLQIDLGMKLHAEDVVPNRESLNRRQLTPHQNPRLSEFLNHIIMPIVIMPLWKMEIRYRRDLGDSMITNLLCTQSVPNNFCTKHPGQDLSSKADAKHRMPMKGIEFDTLEQLQRIPVSNFRHRLGPPKDDQMLRYKLWPKLHEFMVGYKRIVQPLRRQQLGYDARVSLVPVVYNQYFGRVGIHENAIQLRVHVLRLQVAGVTLAKDFHKIAVFLTGELSLEAISLTRDLVLTRQLSAGAIFSIACHLWDCGAHLRSSPRLLTIARVRTIEAWGEPC
jgi:hypothetical protein